MAWKCDKPYFRSDSLYGWQGHDLLQIYYGGQRKPTEAQIQARDKAENIRRISLLN